MPLPCYLKQLTNLAQVDVFVLWGIMVLLLPGLSIQACPDGCTCQVEKGQMLCEGATWDTIPPSGRKNWNLTTIDLTRNRLRLLTLNMLQSNGRLVNLKLKENTIEEIQDGAFQNCRNLQTLDLSNNVLMGVNRASFRGAQHRLLHLDLSYNQLEDMEGSFTNMKELTRLDLRNNRLTALSETVFSDLGQLRYLLLSSNLISSINSKTFKNLKKLMYLVLKENPLGHFVGIQFSSNFLSYVDLSECRLREVPPNLPNSVRYLQLRRNNLMYIERYAFAAYSSLSILVLDENGITTIEDEAFREMSNLQQLWLNSNNLTKIPFPLPASLQRLLLDANKIGAITDTFPQGSQINTLSMMGNNISYISWDALHKLTQLKSLDLSNNKIIQLYSNTFFNSTQLETLQLSKNPIRHLHSRSLHGLFSLNTLSLAYNDLPEVSIADNILEDMRNLRKVDLDASPGVIKSLLESTHLLHALRTVKDLSMQSSDLASLRSDFTSFFPVLETLHISSSRWHCDQSLSWLSTWLRETETDVAQKELIDCFTPRGLYGKPIITINVSEFVPTTTTLVPPTQRTTRYPSYYYGSSTIPTPKSTPSARTTTTHSSNQKEDEEEEFDDDDLDPSEWEHSGTGQGQGNKVSDQAVEDQGIVNTQAHQKPNDTATTQRTIYARKTYRPPSWEEFASQTPPPSGEVRYGPVGNREFGQVDIEPLSKYKTTPTPSLSPAGQGRDPSEQSNITVIILATSISIAVLVIILVSVLMFWCRKKRRKDTYTNAIKYQNRNDVLYFMPGGATENGSAKTKKENGKASSNGNKERMALVPGRDINHEGPLRVYKWEDF